jgi:hypothetical protein
MRLNSRLRQLTKLKAMEYYSEGKSIRQIADILQLSIGKTHSILKDINQHCKDDLPRIIPEVLPTEYTASIALHRSIMDEALEIARTQKEPRIKMEAYRLAIDCRRYLDNLIVDADKIMTAVSSGSNVVGNNNSNRPPLASVRTDHTTTLSNSKKEGR